MIICPWKWLEGHPCCTFHNKHSIGSPGSQPLCSCYTTMLIRSGCSNKVPWNGPLANSRNSFLTDLKVGNARIDAGSLMTGENLLHRWLFAVIWEGGWEGSFLSPLLQRPQFSSWEPHPRTITCAKATVRNTMSWISKFNVWIFERHKQPPIATPS